MSQDESGKDYADAIPFPDRVSFAPIGKVVSPYRERYGTPRQAVVSDGTMSGALEVATIELNPQLLSPDALEGLEGFDYVWVVALLHLNQHWNPTVVPPRGPKVRRGVFATRAPHRPNPIGLSAVRLERIEGHTLHVRGIDLLDGTPVLDIKPYVPYCDAFPDARSGWLDGLDGSLKGPDRPTQKKR